MKGWHNLPFGWLLMIHDDGWCLMNLRRVIKIEGRAPNTGYRRPWWRRSGTP